MLLFGVHRQSPIYPSPLGILKAVQRLVLCLVPLLIEEQGGSCEVGCVAVALRRIAFALYGEAGLSPSG